MAKDKGEKKVQAAEGAGTGDGARNAGAEAAAGADLASPKRGYAKASYDAAYAHAAAGRIAQAEALCRKILTSDPTHAEALQLLGGIAQRRGQNAAAENLIRKAIRSCPQVSDYHNNLGAVLLGQGRADEAIAQFKKAIELDPNFATAHNNLGYALKRKGDFEGAAASFRRTLELRPDLAKAHNNLGALLLRRGETQEAISHFEKAVESEPDCAPAYTNLGHALMRLRRYEDAEGAFERAVKCEPDNALAYNTLGVVLLRQDRDGEAVAQFEKAIELEPNLATAHNNLGTALQRQGRLDETVAAYRRGLGIKTVPGIEVKLATVLPVIPESKDALIRARQRFEAQLDALGKKGLSLEDPYKEVGTTNFYLAYHGMNDRDLQQAVARFYLKACPSLAWTAPTPASGGRTRLRIGFISRYFRDGVVSWNFRGFIERLDRSRFEVVVFTVDDNADAVTHQIRASGDRAVWLPNDLARARQTIADQALDVLVYIDIGTDPFTYFLAFARLALVQCVMPGHPVTTGIPNLDYFISNELAEPPGAEDHYSETLVRLTRSTVYFHRPSPPARPRTREDFGFGTSEHLYACPQSLFKFHPDFDAVLAAILRRDSAGRLVLVKSKIPTETKLLARRLAKSMPDVIDRVRWLPRLSFNDFLSLLIVSDVLLDPLHYSGGTTTRQSFAFNKPVVTLPGDFYRGRMTYGRYRQMGLSECIAKDADDYVDIAVRLGTDPDWRREVEARIAAASPVLYENPAGVRELEEFLLTAAAKAGLRRK